MVTLEYRPGNNEIKMEDANMKPMNERTPRNLQDFNLSPSWMDPNSLFMVDSLAGQHPGLYTPNSGGMGAIFHNQAGDLHTTPTVGLNVVNSLSVANPIQSSQPSMDQFNPQYFAQQMPEMSGYAQAASYAPSASMDHDSYGHMDESGDVLSGNDILADATSNVTASTEFSANGVAPMGMSYAHGEKYVLSIWMVFCIRMLTFSPIDFAIM